MYGIYDGSEVIAQFAAPMTMSSNVPIFVTDALSLKRHSSRRSAQRWELTSALVPLSSGANKLFALLVQKGNTGDIQIVTPQNYGVIKSRVSLSGSGSGGLGITNLTIAYSLVTIPSGTLIQFDNHSTIYVLSSNITIGTTSITLTTGLTTAVSNNGFITVPIGTASAGSTAITVSSNVNLMPRGTFIRFSNHSKIYMLTADRDGNGTMNIYPELRTAVSSTSFKYLDDVLMDCLLDTDTVVGMTYTDGILMDLGTIKLVEKL